MKIDISNILKSDGASLDIELNEPLEESTIALGDFIVDRPVSFKGRLVNAGGVIKLDGHLVAEYRTNCSRCLKDIESIVRIDIQEDFIEEDSNKTDEQYTYQGKYVELDKVIKDNIILNLPVRQICDDECKGFCPKCGVNLNKGKCECSDDETDPRMSILKDFFKGSLDA
ncbi:MAG TPA: DUF177 domain-containing protein [Acetivibrio sp.]|nr:DUF177 domain-containing protein [Clostridium sp.]HOQ36395.1 DUF177 domain-containing protein [Acetivibrio sp.]HPT91082.1 DUF177 domain-containing protein [Acetivibrio sp.]HQA56443.1 DUF177 domain-containing protein [Acetivibrio sp.]